MKPRSVLISATQQGTKRLQKSQTKLHHPKVGPWSGICKTSTFVLALLWKSHLLTLLGFSWFDGGYFIGAPVHRRRGWRVFEEENIDDSSLTCYHFSDFIALCLSSRGSWRNPFALKQESKHFSDSRSVFWIAQTPRASGRRTPSPSKCPSPLTWRKTHLNQLPAGLPGACRSNLCGHGTTPLAASCSVLGRMEFFWIKKAFVELCSLCIVYLFSLRMVPVPFSKDLIIEFC